MVRGDTNGVADVFVHDLRTGRTQRIAEGPATGVALGVADVFVKDLRTGAVERVSVVADGTEADRPAVGSTSLGDHWIAFSSAATNLVRGDTNDTVDVFVGPRS